jgi:uncharacterized protein YneF (UPF0154 family)
LVILLDQEFLIKSKMADKSLIQSAGKLAAAQAAASEKKIDFSKILEPVTEAIGGRVKLATDTTKSFLNSMPSDFKAEKVPAEFQTKLQTFLKENKAEYARLAKEAGKYANNPSSQEYIDAVEGMDKITAGFDKINNSLTSLADKRTQEAENYSELSPGATFEDQARREELIGKKFYDNVELSLDGLSYTDALGNKTNTDDYNVSPVTDPKWSIGILETFEDYSDEKLEFDEEGNPKNIAAMNAANKIGNILQEKGAAADLIFGGIPTDTSGKTIYIDTYLKENPEISENVPKLENGELDKDSDAYKAMINEIKKNPPVKEYTKFLMNTLGGTISDTNTGELD